jgi:hypothetical protein
MPAASRLKSSETSRLVEVSAVVEILVPPQVPSLYFWALQVDFEEDGTSWGGGHTGLQWNRRFAGHRAVNWGGYAGQQLGGGVLPGSEPFLPAFSGDPNTMAYDWRPGRPYRFRIFRSPDIPGAWRADVTDLETGDSTVIRDLMHPRRPAAGGRAGAASRDGSHIGHLYRPMVWSEVFAECDAPSVAVRWSRLAAKTEDGVTVAPAGVHVNYQAHQAGGCANTTVRTDGTGLVQVTNTLRDVPQGARLPLPGD